MKRLVSALMLVVLAGCPEKDLREALGVVSVDPAALPLNETEVVAALKQALTDGISNAAVFASANNGFLHSPRLRLEFPPEAKRVDKALRKLRLGKQVDRFIKQLNRSAERASGRAKPIFIAAIKSMSIGDGFDILRGPDDAATQYLRQSTGDELYRQLLPIVTEKLGETKATSRYDDIVTRYNALPLVRNKVDPDLAGYATEKAVAGLFLLIADEEAKIRANPAARSSELLRRVFGSLD